MSHRKEPPESKELTTTAVYNYLPCVCLSIVPLVSFALKRKNSRVGATMSFNVPQSNLRRQDKLAAKPVSDRVSTCVYMLNIISNPPITPSPPLVIAEIIIFP